MQRWNGSDEYCWRYRADTILSTDGQTDKVKPVYPPFNFVEAEGKMKHVQSSQRIISQKACNFIIQILYISFLHKSRVTTLHMAWHNVAAELMRHEQSQTWVLHIMRIKIRAKSIFTKFGFWSHNFLFNCPLAVWYKTKFGSQNFGYQIWSLFLLYIVQCFQKCVQYESNDNVMKYYDSVITHDRDVNFAKFGGLPSVVAFWEN